MTRPLIVATGAATHSGLRRPLNEDSYMASPPLFLVADGMGGHEAGERASATVIDEFARYIGRVDLELEDLLEALARARSAVEALSTDGSGRAGTTLSGVVVASVEGMGYWLT
ncbi:PP2C family protein-serine/threonine phosphatase, partial [Microbacterium sp. AGC62]